MDYGAQTLKTLKELCRKKGAKTTGKKAHLVERLQAYDRNTLCVDSQSQDKKIFEMQLPCKESYLLIATDVELSRPADSKDISKLDVSIPITNLDIPHYIKEQTNDGKALQESLWFVSVYNRRQQCHYCKDESHWPSRCSNKEGRENKIEKVLGKRKTQETTERKETKDSIKILGKKIQQERTKTYTQTVERKKTEQDKTPKEDFKKPGTNVKLVEKKTSRPTSKTPIQTMERAGKKDKEEERKIRQRSHSDPRKENRINDIQFITPPILSISNINKQRSEEIEERAAKRYKGREETSENSEIDVIT
ncbi:hypothetical protein PoB_000509400 [Plakobranchus ocellatus]|uniref:SAP domain-containing protein n=1 Tax=Plakobranchus ocellatus TaxID=259542 RepID=A0AAV3Y8L8_9GAST|nr:hypothetical protein PoB_000509400 [Plakobranchus ocellatus]